MKYVDGPLRSYLDDLAAKKPAPGGGSAAALAAAIGASLMSMVAHYTVTSAACAKTAPRAADLMVRVQQYNSRLTDLIDEDVSAYGRLSTRMKELKGDPAALEEASLAALRPPYEVCKIAAECMKLCLELVDCGNPRLVTDTAIAAVMLEGAFVAARFNVYANLAHIRDVGFVEEVHDYLVPLEGEMPKLRETIVERCEDMAAG